MNTRLLSLVASILFAQSVYAQTDKPNSPPRSAPAQTTAQSEADNLSQRVVQLYGQGKYDEAIPLAKRVLDIRSPALPDTDPRVLSALGNLAELYLALKKFGDAEPLFQRVLAANESAQKPDQARIAEVLDRLAFISFARGNSSTAESYYKRALDAGEKAFGPDSPRTGMALYSLAEFYRFRFEYGKAEPLFRRSLIIEDNTPATEPTEYRRALSGLTCLLYETSQLDKIKALNEERKARFENASKSGVVMGGVLNGKAISLPRPAYPVAAKNAKLSGYVLVRVVIDESGKVIKAEDLCGAARPLSEASVEAASHARFTPTLLSGQPVKVTGIITYNFVRR